VDEQTLRRFEARARSLGFEEIVERKWEPLHELATHSHPFAFRAIVVRGQMWLTVGAKTRHLQPGDTFELDCEVPHAERYGPEGATYRVARRRPAAG